MFISDEEKYFLDVAVQEGLRLGRPFRFREVSLAARQNGYQIIPTADPRFVKVQDRPPMWIVDLDVERIQMCHLSDFFSAVSGYARRCYSQAGDRAQQRIDESKDAYGKAHIPVLRDEMVREELERMGWTLERYEGQEEEIEVASGKVLASSEWSA